MKNYQNSHQGKNELHDLQDFISSKDFLHPEISDIKKILEILEKIDAPLPNTTTGLTGKQMANNIQVVLRSKNPDFTFVTRAFGLRKFVENFYHNALVSGKLENFQ